jgi:hypothetical protein
MKKIEEIIKTMSNLSIGLLIAPMPAHIFASPERHPLESKKKLFR